jgi:hypothetical protein
MESMDPIAESIRYVPDSYASSFATAAWILAVGIFALGGLFFYFAADGVRRLLRARSDRRAATRSVPRLGRKGRLVSNFGAGPPTGGKADGAPDEEPLPNLG